MKKQYAVFGMFMCIITLLSGCDPIYPTGKLKVENIKTLSQGESAKIELVYPNTGGTIVSGWKNEVTEIVNDEGVVELSEFTVKGIKPGTATIKVRATTVVSNEALAEGYKEREYWTEVKVTVQ